MNRASIGVLVCAVALWGCDDESTGDSDAGGVILMDSGGGGGTDAGGGGGTDAGPGGGTDAGPGGGTDAGPGGGSDAGPGGGSDAGPGGTMGIDCMGTTCDETTEQCCVTGGLGGGASGMCIPRGDECMGGTADCDGPEDCSGSGEICCARVEGLSSASSTCTTEMCGGGFTSFELCHTPADCTDTTQMCCPVMMFGFSGAYCSDMCGFMPPGP